MKRRKILLRRSTPHNDIEVIEEGDGTRVLRLDRTSNIHSVLVPGQTVTHSYWDDFALAPPVIPEGPIGVLGLGAGTVVRLYRQFWPMRRLVAWEIDEVVVEVARAYFGLADEDSLRLRISDAFEDDAADEGPFAALLVDIFAGGSFHPRLTTPAVWRRLAGRLMPKGRVMVNVSGKADECLAVFDAMKAVWGSDLSSKRTKEAWNLLFLTGPPPDLEAWSAALPPALVKRTDGWQAATSARAPGAEGA